MRYAVFLIMALCGLGSVDARAGVIADMSAREISISSKFSGTDLLLFGARQAAGNVVYVIRGPNQSFQVSKKERVAGIWVNSRPVRFHDVPGYYLFGSDDGLALADNAALTEDLDIIRPEAFNENGAFPLFPARAEEYHAPLLAELQRRGLYSVDPGEISFYGDTLFKANIPFSKHIPRGTYTAEIYLFADNTLQSVQNLPIIVQKTGFDAFLYDTAYQHPLLYGIISVLCALAAGWVAGRVFRR